MKQSLLLFFLFFSYVAPAQTSPWKWINPRPQGNPLQHVTAIDGTQHAIAVGDYGTILRSTDAGQHWQLVESPTREPLRAVTFFTQTRGVAVGRGVLLKTADGGQSWTMGSAPGIDLEAVVFTDQTTGFVAGRGIAGAAQQTGYIYKTTDGGNTWTKVYEASSYGFRRLTAAGRDVVYATRSFTSVILVTADGGSSWGPLPFATGSDDLDIQFIDGTSGVLTAQGFDGTRVYVTGDRGATWQQTATGIGGRLGLLPGSVLYVTDQNRVYLSTDKGRTWRQKYAGPARISRAVLCDSLHAVAIGTSGELYHAGTAAPEWTPLHTNLAYTYEGRFTYSTVVRTLHFPSAATGYAAVDYGNDIFALMKTTNGGCQWENVASFFNPIQCIYFLDDQTGFVAHGRPSLVPGQLSKTTDGGKTWTGCAIPRYSGRIHKLHFTSPANGVAVTYDGEILLSTDGGRNWTTNEAKRFCCGEKYDLQFVNNTRGFLVNAGFNIYRSDDGGRNWQSVYFNSAVLLRNLHFVTPSVGYAVGEENSSAPEPPGVVLKTVDGGNTWSLIRKTTARVQDVHFSDPATGFVVGRYGNILATRDGGTTWQDDPSPTANEIDCIFPTQNGTFYLWGYGTSTLLKRPVKPVADFTPSQSAICTNDTLGFTNRSKDSYNYTWKIGEEVFSTEPSPKWVFTKPGSYVITLIADNCGDSDTLQKPVTVLPLPPKPILRIGGSPVNDRHYLACDVDSLTINTAPLPEYQSYFWKGKAVPGGASLTIYRSDTVFVKVQGKNGCFAASDTLRVTLQKSPTAAFTPVTSCLSVGFENTSRFGERYHWDFGDGTTDTARSPVHQFADSGRYHVQLTVFNACGEARVSQWLALALPIKPQLTIGGTVVATREYVACNEDTLVVSAPAAPGGTAYFWNGSAAAGAPSLRMTAPGNVYVRIRNANGCFAVSDTLRVRFQKSPRAGFDYAVNGFKVAFTNTSGPGAQFRWYFGDGSVDTTRSPVHTYLEAGNYRVALTAVNACGSDSVSKVVPVVITSVEPAPRVARLRVFPNPAHGLLYVDLPAGLGRPAAVSLVNAVGIVHRVVVAPATNRLPVNVAGFEAGVYLLKVDWPDRYGSQKIVIR